MPGHGKRDDPSTSEKSPWRTRARRGVEEMHVAGRLEHSRLGDGPGPVVAERGHPDVHGTCGDVRDQNPAARSRSDDNAVRCHAAAHVTHHGLTCDDEGASGRWVESSDIDAYG